MEKQTYKLEDILDLKALHKLMNALAQSFEVGLGVRTVTGERIIEDSYYCHFCSDVIWPTEEGNRQCELSDMEIVASPNGAGPCIYRCRAAGLMDAGIKIMIEGEHIASILVGQIRLEEEQLSEEEYREMARKFGVDEELYLKRLQEVPLKTRDKFEHIVEALTIIADQLSTLGYLNLRQKSRIGTLESKESILQSLAEKDALTGLWNRRKFESCLEEYGNRKDMQINLISGDANNLKLMNDIFGHEAGDKMLHSIAHKMRNMAKDEWIVARCGGDEFHVLLPDATMKMAKNYCDRVTNSCKNDRRLDLPLSIAFGVAEWDSSSETLQECFQRADSQMYENKKRMKQQENLLDYILEKLYDRCYLFRGNIEAEMELAYNFARHLGFDETGAQNVMTAVKYQDIGMIKLPENFVMKGKTRTPEEDRLIRAHVTNGYNIALQFENTYKVAEFILCSHENWDGNSYPRGLRGQAIPLESRIVRMVDNYCNWVVPNAKKIAVGKERAYERLKEHAGEMFDPDMVEWFIDYLEKQGA